MKITKQFRELSRKELEDKLAEFKKELLKLNAQLTSGANTASPGKVRQTKKNIARINTLLAEKGVSN